MRVVVVTRQRDGSLDAGDTGEWQAGQLGEVVGLEDVAGPEDAADAFLVFGRLVVGRVREEEQAFGGGGVDVLPGLEGAAEEGKVNSMSL